MSASKKMALIIWVSLAALFSVLLTGILWLPYALGAEDIVIGVPVMDPQIWSWGLLGAALATGLSSLGAAYAVGSVGAAAIGALAEKPELFGRVMIFVGLAEGIAIYGLIVSILILNRLV